MKKILVIPGNKKQISYLLQTNIDGIILPLEHLSVNSTTYFNIDEIRKIKTMTHKEINISVNKTMTNSDLPLLEKSLQELDKINVNKVLFYDLAVINIAKRLHLKLDLVISQDHLNTNSQTNLFYKNRGINYTLITNDITKDEINEISKHQSLMLICYGYLPIFYSRRYLITNYLNYINKKKKDAIYTIKDKEKNYIIEEEEFGTTIYTPSPINLINKLDELSIDYVILNANHIEDEKFKQVLNQYLERQMTNEDNYIGFLEKKTVYKVEDYE